MNFISFLLLLLIIFVVWPIARIAWAAFKLKRQYNNFVNQARKAAQEAQAANHRGDRGEPGRAKSKVVSPDEGEYVDWEELEVNEQTQVTEAEAGSRRQSKVSSYVSERITDVEWEDISE